MYVCVYVCLYIHIRSLVGVHMHSCRRILFICTVKSPYYFWIFVRQRKQSIYDALSSRPKTCCASPFPFGKVHAIRRVEGVGGCELSLKNSPRSAESANEFGQPTSWPRTDAPTVRRAHVKGRPRPRRQRGPKPISSRLWAS